MMKKISKVLIIVASITLLCACSIKKEYEVVFDTRGGSSIDSQTVKKGQKVDKPKDPKKEGYSFNGWFLDSKEFDFDTKIKEDITLTAKWKLNKKTDIEETTEENVCNVVCKDGYALLKDSCTCKKIVVEEKTRTDKVNAQVTTNSSFNINSYIKGKGTSYKSSDEKIATIDNEGNVKTKSSGVVEITIKTSDNDTYVVILTIEDSYTYKATKLDESDISYKVVILKNNEELSSDILEKINAVYTKDNKYIGRYEKKYKTIIVDKSQVDLIKMFKLDDNSYELTKVK